MKKTTLIHTAVAVAALGMMGAHAEGLDLKVSGYGTVAAAVTSDHAVEFHRDGSTSKGVSNAVDLGNDSRFGLQAALKFNERISFTGQVVAQRRTKGAADTDVGQDKDLDPGVEWLYMQYDALPSLNGRLGRVALPAFLLSDSLNVGFAAPWLRAPVHLYSSQPLTHIDGLQLNWRDSLGGFNLSAQAAYGKSEANIEILGDIVPIVSQDTSALSFSVEHGDWLGRVGMVKLTNANPLGTLHDKYLSAGLQYDNGDLVAMAEYAKRTQNKYAELGNMAIVTGKYGYVAAGYRFGAVLPMLIWSTGDQTLADFHGGAIPNHSTSLGMSVRYDVAPNVALKAQLDQYKANDSLAFVVPADDKRKVRVFTIGADFVF